MSINEVRKFHVFVKVPDEISTRYHETQLWNQMTCRATEGSIEAGANRWSEHEEWADFWSYAEAVVCEKKLHEVIAHFNSKLLEDKQREAQEDENV